MRVSELMHTPVVTCTSTARLGEVARLMRDRNVGAVLVIDQIGYLAGIVTDRDLAVRGLGAGRSADIEVETVMTRDVVTTTLGADVSDAVSIMAKHAVRRLPVVDEQDHPHGMVTVDDVVRHLGSQTDALADMMIRQASQLPSS